MRLEKANLKQLKELYKEYYTSLNGGFDSYYEDHLLADDGYVILQDDLVLGCYSLSKDNRLCGLFVKKEFQHQYESIFHYVIHEHNIDSIMGVTNDTLLTNQMIKQSNQIQIQAVNFIYNVFPKTSFLLKRATLKQLDFIEETFDDFLDDYETSITNDELYLGYRDHEVVSIGNVEYSKLHDNVVSIGMAVIESKRNQGYGRKTIKALGKQFMTNGYRVQAGCWYYNHPSKRALQGADMSEANYIVIVKL